LLHVQVEIEETGSYTRVAGKHLACDRIDRTIIDDAVIVVVVPCGDVVGTAGTTVHLCRHIEIPRHGPIGSGDNTMPRVESGRAPFRMHVVTVDWKALPAVSVALYITQRVVAEDSDIPLVTN